MRLFIAEKPLVARAIASNIGSPVVQPKTRNPGYIELANGDFISWCIGHLFELAMPSHYGKRGYSFAELPILPEIWKRVGREDREDQIKVLRTLIKKTSHVVHGGDIGREGQVIVDEVLEELAYTGKVSRLWLNAVDDISVKRALSSLRNNDDYRNLYNAGVARARADWLVGMNLSPAFTLAARKSGADVTLSVGRVQTPTLAIVVQRDLEIENFVSKDYYLVSAEFAVKAGEFQGRLKTKKDEPGNGIDEVGRIIDHTLAERIVARVKSGQAAITKHEVKNVKEHAPNLYFLTSLSFDASSRYGFGAKQVLDICQSLYDKGLQTYPRVDCEYLPDSQHKDAGAILQHLAQNFSIAGKASASIKSPAFNDSKVTEHHAIVPTLKAANLPLLTPDEQKVYEMVALRYIAHFFPQYVYDKTSIEVTVTSGADKDIFTASGRVDVNQGWRAVLPPKPSKDDDAKLPMMMQGEQISVRDAKATTKKTEPPDRFTEGSLLKMMENVHNLVSDPEIKKRLKEVAGIGTVATRPSIIETLHKREYIKAVGKTIISTENGRRLIAAAPRQLKDPGTTALWESYLESVKDGKITVDAFLKEQSKQVISLVDRMRDAKIEMTGRRIQEAKVVDTVCDKCKKPMREMTVRKGKYAGKKFLGCTGYPVCDHTVWPEDKKSKFAKSGKSESRAS